MRSNYLKTLKTAVLAVTILLLGARISAAQQQINLTAGPAILVGPDGIPVPMWGYSCGALVTGSTATCAPLNPNVPLGGWSPVIITVPVGAAGGLQINLTNNLTFTPTGSTTANTVPTSLVIVGQVGGGLGAAGTGCTAGGNCTPSPVHASQAVTWSTVGGSPAFTPPGQGPRVQSFGTEVAATGATPTANQVASGSGLTWANLRPGTYLLESGTHPSIQVPMGLIGIVVVTTAPSGTTAGCAYPGATAGSCAVNYNSEVPLLLSEIDPVQNSAVNAAVNTAGFSETAVWSGQPGGCGNPTSTTFHTCYPPAVNYTPLYYAINGVSFNKTAATNSVFQASAVTGVATGATGQILVRLVNGGLRMHVPSILNSLTLPAGATIAPTTPVPGFSLVAEDGNLLPGVQKVQHEVFMAAGKTYDVMINVPPVGAPALPIYDRELSLSANAVGRDGGMMAYIGVNGSTIPTGIAGVGAAVANADTYNSLVAGQPLVVSDPSKGVIANDVNVYGVTLLTAPANGTVALAANGTFTYTPTGTATSDSFTYCANGTVTGTTCSSGITATVTLGAAAVEAASGITCTGQTFNANTSTYLIVKNPGVLAGCKDAAGYPLTVNGATAATPLSLTVGGGTILLDAAGGFTASGFSAGTYTFSIQAKNSQGTAGAATTMTVVFPTPSNLAVTVLDGSDHTTQITDYRWIIEEDRTFYINPNCTQNPPPAGCPSAALGIVPTLGVNFHTSYMPFVAQGCTGPVSCEGGQTQVDPATGLHNNVVCDVGNGVCRPDSTASGFTAVNPSQVALDPTKHYYISVLPGDAANPFYGASATGHGMGGAPIQCPPPPAAACTAFPAVTVLTQPSPYPPAKLSVFVFEDDFPLNGEQDGGGGIDVLSPNEPGLGQFQIHLWDAFGGDGDFTGQMTYDMFNQPLTNSLAGMKDPSTGLDACPVVLNPLSATTGANPTTLSTDPTATGKTGMIVTCPKYEADGHTLSPLAGFAVIDNLMPGRWGVVATPGADRIARGEEWLQTNTLDGQKAHDAFTRIAEPAYFQEFSPAGPHVSIGFANPAIINARLKYVCNGTDPNLSGNCSPGNTLTGKITSQRLSRPPDERLYSSGSRDAFGWTQCYVSVGDPDGEDFAFAKCAADGTFTLSGLPDGDWRITTFDQWNDQLVDGLSTPVRLGSATSFCPGAGSSQHVCNMGDIAATQWQTNVQTRTCIDENHDGVCQADEGGAALLNVAVRKRDGELENLLVTDFNGVANFNETFPLFSWYTVETDTTRYKNTGTHVVYDVGGPADGSTFRNVDGSVTTCTPGGAGGYPPCGTSTIAKNLADTAEIVSLPANLRVPGAVYCANADCTGKSILNGPGSSDPPSVCTTATTAPYATTCSTTLSSGRIDPPWVGVEGWQGFPGQFNFIEFGKEPYVAGENGGIKGHVIYASTRPFDDPQMLVQTQWEPLVPHVTINLYKEGFASDGVTPTLTLVDTTQTSSFDEWAQGFRSDGVPYMNCPGQGSSTGTIADLFFFTLNNQPEYLDWYNSLHGGAAPSALPNNSQFKCYDGMHNWNQLEPAPYDGMYAFPSVNSRNPSTGAPQAVSVSISAISETGGLVTVTTSATHGLISGAQVTIAGAPTGYNSADYTPAKLFAISVTGPKTFTYAVPTTGLASGTAGSVAANATNCTACTPNTVVPTTDLYYGLPMLAAGKYVVEVVVPPGFELVKEEDKNILIGDNFIAPVTQQFGGLGNVFILPDQASVAAPTSGPWAGSGQWAGAGYNANNAQNPTQSFGAIPENGIVPGFVPEPIWPCVGEARIVPDYISLYPQSHQVSPFAGATRRLCDRKEVTLSDQMGAIAKFYIYTSTHIASKFTGGITNDMTSEFDPFSPQFGEKFSPPDLPISVKDWAGNEISRVYSDHFGLYNGMTYSTWEVNPPNPTGYSPTMMVVCMNDQGTNASDPLFNPEYSQFCYELPFMPGVTTYLDTPVVPTAGFAGAGYNDVDCSYPTLTPAIREVDGDGVGPWVSAAGHTLTITALGDQQVRNYGYSGPSFTTAPWNQKTINRHYGFGSTKGTVTIGGFTIPAANITTWSDSQIILTIPAANAIPACPIQQQAMYGGSPAQCGQLVITASNGLSSIDAVTVTIGGKQPTHVAASASVQAAIDAADPGDLIIVDPTCTGPCTTDVVTTTTTGGVTTTTYSNSTVSHNEMLIMWKPVRLQGVGSASSIINASPHPAGKLDPWRRQVNCLFGLALNGFPSTGQVTVNNGQVVPGSGGTNPFDPTGTYQCGSTNGTGWTGFNATGNNPQIDRLPLEATVGWDANLNGNLAELLQEPSLMGALEGAGITVLGKGVFFPSNPFDPTLLAGFPTGTVLFTSQNTGTYCNGAYPSNFWCNPSSIDGLGITNSSQGGGGVFVHGWNHNLQMANNHIYGNVATLSGVSIGQGEFPGAYIQGSATNAAPGSCETSSVNGAQLPYCHNMNINVHNNNISLNASLGDELFSATPAGAGGISFCTGSDYYQFNFNWVCGNLSSGDGGGFGHLGYSKNADIEHNAILFNQSTNPTIPANGGGMIVMGTPDVDPTCGTQTDQDCVPPAGSVGPSDGIGPGMLINANLIMGNSAESGSGGGVAFQNVNGADVVAFPTGPNPGFNSPGWHHVVFQNNIVADNVAGWDGAGISALDALYLDIVNNTVVSNTTTASAGPLATTIGAPLASVPSPQTAQNCTTASGGASCPQPAGLVSIQNSAVLSANLPATVTCPPGHFAPGTSATNGACRSVSYPLLTSNIFWQNSAYYIGVGAFTSQYQQNVVSLYNAFTTTLAPNQPTADATTAHGAGLTITGGTGACTPASYWDIGVRGDTGPTNHGSGFTLNPVQSVLTSTTGYTSGTPSPHNTTNNPNFASQYCNGSRIPPEACSGVAGGCGWQVPPGIADATVPNPIFNLTPVATVDEGNNWINMRWGPLSLVNPATNAVLGNYALTTGSPVIDWVPSTVAHPLVDFFGNVRPETGSDSHFDPGAIEFGSVRGVAVLSVSPTSLTFPATPATNPPGSSAPRFVTLRNTGNIPATGISEAFTGPFSRPAGFGSGSCGATLAAGATCTIGVVFSPTTVGANAGTLTITAAGVTVTGSPVALSGTGTAVGELSFTSATNGTLTQMVFGPALTFTIPTPRAPVTSVVTVSNIGTLPVTITAETLLLNFGGLYSITGSTCQNATAPLLPFTLAGGGSCTVSIRYATPTTPPIFPDLGTFGVANNGAGTVGGSSVLFLVAQ